jgi:hypothetical protein
MEEINFEDIYIQLYAYADQLLKALIWFRKDKSDSYLKGQQAHDYAMGAIEKYLREPEKYNSTTGRSLVNYLKRHLIRSAISNDVRSLENLTSSDIISMASDSSEDDYDTSNIDAILPYVSAHFDEEIDYERIITEIENEIKDDQLVKLIFEEVSCKQHNRRDVIARFKLNENDYDNAMKRLKRILNKVCKRYEL